VVSNPPTKEPDCYTGSEEEREAVDAPPRLPIAPAGSLDGKHMAFASGRAGRQKIKSWTRTQRREKLTDGEFLDAWPDMATARTRKQIAFASNRSGKLRIWLRTPTELGW